MKKRQNTSKSATALRSTLLAALISVAAVLFASSFKAAPPASGLSAAIVPPFEGDRDTDSGSWTATGSLSNTRAGHTATLLPNGKVLAVGGYHGNPNYLTSAELYDPANGSWTVTGNLNDARTGHTATLLSNGKVLVAGGLNDSGPPGTYYLSSAELYDPASGTWTLTGSLNFARGSHTATLLPNGKVLVTGGWTNTSDFAAAVRSAELYDPTSGTWTVTGSLISARAIHTATLLLNGKVLVAGGENSSEVPLASAELYDPGSGSWMATGSLQTLRRDHTATFLPNGKVLAVGGYGGFGNGYLSSAELYDPVSGTWTATDSLNLGREDHTATLLPSGKVLVAGGTDGVGVFANAELYDPENGMWSATGSLNTTRAGHTATLLPNGAVLVAAGTESLFMHMPVPGRSAELYETGAGICSICHKRTVTLSLACDSLEYRRHLDHGDTVGACPPSKKPSDQTDSLGQD